MGVLLARADLSSGTYIGLLGHGVGGEWMGYTVWPTGRGDGGWVLSYVCLLGLAVGERE